MSKAIYYPGADRNAQWAARKFPGDQMNTNTVVLHTTESTGWPSYSTGYFPNLTYNAAAATRWRQHLPLDRSARALENRAGGVPTNTLNVVQVELVGTCDPKWHKAHGGLFWPTAPEAALDDVAAFLAFMAKEWGVKLVAPAKWPAYPTSYGNGGGQRMTGKQWLDFYGVAGHMHVPENDHGDPGNIAIAKILTKALVIVTGKPAAPAPPPPAAPKPTVPVEQARYEALLANEQQTEQRVLDVDAKVVALQAQVAEALDILKGDKANG